MKNKAVKILGELCRNHISALIVITLIDLCLLAADESVTVCFSLLLPQQLLARGIFYAGIVGESNLLICGWLTALICLAMLAVCFISSFKTPGWLLCAAGMVLLDTGVAIFGVSVLQDSSYYFDIAAHVYIIAALVAGYIIMRLAPDNCNPTDSGSSAVDESVNSADTDTDKAPDTCPEQDFMPEAPNSEEEPHD